MIEATEIQAQGDLFDFLRIIDDGIIEVMGSDEISSDSSFSSRSNRQTESVILPETKIKEKA
ncbi:hypothetical protein [uncultured Desulfobacter sp.]|uniref:hypothetical protein n=1 Tax=uncultured Desulfobacter sp. TaxID=240139 RepID=UPI002AAAE645|nr:hypothetical protein [uncultured Desulfobacter sp.]